MIERERVRRDGVVVRDLWRRYWSVAGIVLALVVLGACGQDASVDESAEPAVADQTADSGEVSDDGEVDADASDVDNDDDVVAQESTTTTTEATTTTTAVDTTTTTEVDTTQEPGDQVAADDALTSQVTLLDAGEEPRQELRLVLTQGQEIATSTTNQVVEQFVDGESLVPAQPVETISDLVLTRAVVGGGVEATTEITGARSGPATDPELVDFLEATLTDLVGLTTTVVVDDRGVVSQANASEANNELANDLLSESINQSNPFPEEAVGVGGSWLTTSTVQEQGLITTLETTSTVREFTANGFVIDMTLVQRLEQVGEEVDLGGVFAVVDRWDIAGTGTAEFDFSQITPVRSTVSLAGTQAFTFEGQDNIEQRLMTETVVETVG